MNTNHRSSPWSADELIVTDAGLETWLTFQQGVELPSFAAYPLASTNDGRRLLIDYYGHYLDIARTFGVGVALETPTWRANPDWAATLGHDRATLARMIAASVDVVRELRHRWTGHQPFIVGGTVGPRGDGYRIDMVMDTDAAAAYHSFQIGHMAAAGIDVVTAVTMGYTAEAIGISHAARQAGLPVVISFTVETDGRLPSGMTLADAIETTDDATGAYPIHYMINCAHPSHFGPVLEPGAGWAARIGGLRANASALSHAELDNMLELDAGDPHDLAARYVGLRGALPALHVLGGCCGTDHRHVTAIVEAWQRRA